MVILHEGCRKYTNRLLAAAVMYEIYDADDAIGQVTGEDNSCLSLDNHDKKSAICRKKRCRIC